MDEQQTAVLESHPPQNQIHPDGDCFQFWYFLHYYDTGSLRVILVSEDGGIQTLAEIEGDMGPTWRTERLPIKSDQKYTVGKLFYVPAFHYVTILIGLFKNCQLKS